MSFDWVMMLANGLTKEDGVELLYAKRSGTWEVSRCPREYWLLDETEAGYTTNVGGEP
jgi:hypothetical protein